jgi:hypothetical protein
MTVTRGDEASEEAKEEKVTTGIAASKLTAATMAVVVAVAVVVAAAVVAAVVVAAAVEVAVVAAVEAITRKKMEMVIVTVTVMEKTDVTTTEVIAIEVVGDAVAVEVTDVVEIEMTKNVNHHRGAVPDKVRPNDHGQNKLEALSSCVATVLKQEADVCAKTMTIVKHMIMDKSAKSDKFASQRPMSTMSSMKKSHTGTGAGTSLEPAETRTHRSKTI